MAEKAADGLSVNMTAGITTVGCRTGQPRRIEIWSHYLDGSLFITSSPGKRGWYANLVANPDFTYHVRGRTPRDVPATARPITDEDTRRAIFNSLKEASPYWARHMDDVEDWVQESCLVEVVGTQTLR